MKVLKLGGKSLANGAPIQKAIDIITKAKTQDNIVVVVSARGNNTNELINLSKIAVSGENFKSELISFFDYHKAEYKDINFDWEYSELHELLKAVQALKIITPEIQDRLVSYGELISAKCICQSLRKKNISALPVDAREFIVANRENQEIIVDWHRSEELTKNYFSTFDHKSIPIVTGYIGSTKNGETITLGRNGSNYSATLIANFLNAEEVINWTNIDGFYTADPFIVKTAQQIKHLSFKEANELAQFGANIIHPKTISPLIDKNIPLSIKNSFYPEKPGTKIDSSGSVKGIKAVNLLKNCSLITIEGKGMADKVGIDAKIFTALSEQKISIKVISQASSERSIGFVIELEDNEKALNILHSTFLEELKDGTISNISSNTNIAVIAITGRHNYALEKAISGLRKNKIWLHLIANSISGEHISLVIDNSQVKKALNVVHNQVFGATKTLNVFTLGKGTVGKTLIEQVLQTSDSLAERRKLAIKIIGVANSSKYFIDPEGISNNWEEQLNQSELASNLPDILESLQNSELENIVIVDNTANRNIAENYDQIIRKGFDIIASNKIANTLPIETYLNFRRTLKDKNRKFFYETNVGAGLPVIDTIKQLVDSDEEVLKISGIFSGSLSYIFNTFSKEERPFSEILLAAKETGYTEPDPREDLEGNDVARKLLILARELGLKVNLEDIKIQNLIPESLQNFATWEEFCKHFSVLDEYYQTIKNSLNSSQVLRYIGELNNKGEMTVRLAVIESENPLAQLKGSDSQIQIFTTSYGDQPIIIQGAGAGAKVTARGVYSDLVRIGNLL